MGLEGGGEVMGWLFEVNSEVAGGDKGVGEVRCGEEVFEGKVVSLSGIKVLLFSDDGDISTAAGKVVSLSVGKELLFSEFKKDGDGET
jgi:hypothetical protein